MIPTMRKPGVSPALPNAEITQYGLKNKHFSH